MTVCRIAITLALGAGSLLAAQPSAIDPAIRSVLTGRLRFSERDLAEMQRGRVVQHALASRAAGEIAVVGGVRIAAPKATFFAHVRDIARFKRGPNVMQIGRFSHPPVLEDLAALTVTKDDFDAKSCGVGDCDVRLSAADIKRIAAEVGDKGGDAPERGAALFKQILFDAVSDYVSASSRAIQYDDGSWPIRPREEFEGVLSGMPEIGELMPALPDHLRQGSAGTLPDAEDFLYWSKEKFGIGPFISVTHVTIVCATAATCLMTTRDVYSSRYLDASIALAIATDAGPDAFDLVYDNRSRANALKGTFAGLRRSIAERRARGSLEDSLKAIKMQLEKG